MFGDKEINSNISAWNIKTDRQQHFQQNVLNIPKGYRAVVLQTLLWWEERGCDWDTPSKVYFFFPKHILDRQWEDNNVRLKPNGTTSCSVTQIIICWLFLDSTFRNGSFQIINLYIMIISKSENSSGRDRKLHSFHKIHHKLLLFLSKAPSVVPCLIMCISYSNTVLRNNFFNQFCVQNAYAIAHLSCVYNYWESMRALGNFSHKCT